MNPGSDPHLGRLQGSRPVVLNMLSICPGILQGFGVPSEHPSAISLISFHPSLKALGIPVPSWFHCIFGSGACGSSWEPAEEVDEAAAAAAPAADGGDGGGLVPGRECISGPTYIPTILHNPGKHISGDPRPIQGHPTILQSAIL